MNFLQFLATLENTLEQISVRGKEDIDRMEGIFFAITKMRKEIILEMGKEENPNKQEPQGGEVDGRQSDIGVDSGNDSQQQ